MNERQPWWQLKSLVFTLGGSIASAPRQSAALLHLLLDARVRVVADTINHSSLSRCRTASTHLGVHGAAAAASAVVPVAQRADGLPGGVIMPTGLPWWAECR